jgi:hypothetical protein
MLKDEGPLPASLSELRRTSRLRGSATVVCHLPSVICLLSSVVCLLSSVFCHLNAGPFLNAAVLLLPKQLNDTGITINADLPAALNPLGDITRSHHGRDAVFPGNDGTMP